jgi:SAM-dependent methyltransferase
VNSDPVVLNAEVTEMRNQMVAALKARHAAGVVPDDLMGMVRGFQESRIVLPPAEENIAAAGLSGRVRLRVGDLRHDEFGEGYDLILLSAVCHMLDHAENQDLLARVGRALAPGGRAVIQDHIMQAEKTAPRAGALFAINMLVGTPGGSTYS